MARECHSRRASPFQEQYSKKERHQLLHEKIGSFDSWVLSGSISAWEITDINFSHAVLLNIDTPTRIQRLKIRELERFGNSISDGGDMYDEHTEFLRWASCCETGELEGRSLPLERKFLESNCTNLFDVERDLPLEVLIKSITAFLD